jgi:hypothetical protein
MPQIHESLSGQKIVFDDPEPKVAKLLKEARAIVEDPKRTKDELVSLIYGSGNPILDQTLFPERGAVTAAVLENKVYHVLTDLLARKEAQVNKTDLKKVASRYTMTVAEAAERLHLSEDAIRRAIRDRRLPAWVKEKGAYFIDPNHLELLMSKIARHGPINPGVQPLEYSVGYAPDESAFMRFKVPGDKELPEDRKGESGKITRWRRVGVLTGGHGKIRFQELQPSPQDAEINFHGFFVKGKFRVTGKLNNMKEVRSAWEDFEAQ